MGPSGIEDRKSTRLNSSHTVNSYAVFCLKKKKRTDRDVTGLEAKGWFYGSETVRDWRGESRVNLFARVDQSEWPFFFNDTATTEIYTLSLHDALPICFYFPAFNGSVSLPVAGYDYNSDWT